MVHHVKVLTALDFGESSLEALRQARALTHGVGATLANCHVLPARSELAELFGAPSREESAALTSEEEEARRALTRHAREKLGLELTEIFVDRGTPYAEIVRRGELIGADFIVVGSHGRSALARAFLGSSAERVVRYAHCSVLVARQAPKDGLVLAAVDVSQPGQVIEAASLAATRRGARLIVASVLDLGSVMPSAAGNLVGAMPVSFPPELRDEMRTVLKSTLEGALKRAGAAGEALVLEGSPALEIVRTAEELAAELVVVGTQGRTGLTRLTLGSVAERVVRSVSSSVLAVRTSGAG
jgi:nucleotide-binding universal stress UspA family protein